MLNVGDTVPDFQLPDQSGELVTLDELVAAGEFILYFYPADFSPVCTAEACSFRDSYAGLEELGIQIVGVSPQSHESHRRFANSFSIPFPLLADPGKKLVRAAGVDGPMGFGVRRATYLVGTDKVVRNRVVADVFIQSHMDLIREVQKTKK
ncbi:MAG: peroxiredoxin Q/BCP [Limisphaerales bacterium]